MKCLVAHISLRHYVIRQHCYLVTPGEGIEWCERGEPGGDSKTHDFVADLLLITPSHRHTSLAFQPPCLSNQETQRDWNFNKKCEAGMCQLRLAI